MKLKPFNGRKKCKDGEVYWFKKGVAVVPGMWFRDPFWGFEPVTITFAEFIKENKNGR